jgi:hypothetical protein
MNEMILGARGGNQATQSNAPSGLPEAPPRPG